MYSIQALGENCVGCGACLNICPQNAISMIVGEDGFYKPEINEKTCVSCGECDRICPQLGNRHYGNDPEPPCYALAASDEIRWQCSSGGAFPLMAMQVLKEGGKVYGCAYGEGMRAEHVGVDSLEELPKLYRSKYVESYIGYAYREVEADLKAGRTVLFCGVPCQIAALKAYLGQEYEKLFLVDLLCHSAAPAGVFLEYVEELQNRFGKKVSSVDFRGKSKGWGMHAYNEPLPIIFEDESRYDSKDDPYLKGFLQRLFKKEACDACHYCAMPRQGDLTIGDFWGIDTIKPELNDGKGLSLVLVNSKKGEMLLSDIAPSCKRLERIDCDIRRYNRFFNAPVSETRKTQKAHFYALHKKRPVSEAIERALKQKYDIGLLGCWSGRNYGTQLTYYALYKILTDEGYDVLMIERPAWTIEENSPFLFAQNPYPAYAVAPFFSDIGSMKELNDKCDMFLLGSDQLWNRNILGEHVVEELLLAFAHTNKRKIAYGTSFGRSALEASSSDIVKMRLLFKRLHRISVRERSGVDICRDHFGVSAEHVLDPVFLCDPACYHAFAERSSVEYSEPYLLCYILVRTEQKRIEIERLARKFGRRVVCVFLYDKEKCTWAFEGTDCLFLKAEDCSIEDWLCYIKHCDMILTDSYHGFCFAIILHKQVFPLFDISLAWQRMCSLERICSLTALLGISEPKPIESSAFFDALELYHVDYDDLDKKTEEERLRSKQWLLNALQTDVPESQNSFDLTYDVFATDILGMKDKIKELEREIHRLKCEKRNVFVFGAGRAFAEAYNRLSAEGVTIRGVADNDPQKWGKLLPHGAGIVCISPDELKNAEQPYVIISVQDASVAKEIKRQLQAMGIKDIACMSELF